MTFLFWNINKRPLQGLIAELVEEHDADVLILAESQIATGTLLERLNEHAELYFSEPKGYPIRLKIYSRLPDENVTPVDDHRYVAIRRVKPLMGDEILMVAAHLPSRLYYESADLDSMCIRIAQIIEEAEQDVGHSRTLVLGDLNVNPFSAGMVNSDGFNAVMDRMIAQKRTRRVAGVSRPFFYNPMWNFFGDSPPGPPGTYFYDSKTPVNFFWNMFDQVLIRPDLLQAFADGNLRIVTQVGTHSLLGELGRPEVRLGSDHLPIVLTLND